MPTCVFVFIFMLIAASANATIVPEDKYGAEIKTDANGQNMLRYIAIGLIYNTMTILKLLNFQELFITSSIKKPIPLKLQE